MKHVLLALQVLSAGIAILLLPLFMALAVIAVMANANPFGPLVWTAEKVGWMALSALILFVMLCIVDAVLRSPEDKL